MGSDRSGRVLRGNGMGEDWKFGSRPPSGSGGKSSRWGGVISTTDDAGDSHTMRFGTDSYGENGGI